VWWNRPILLPRWFSFRGSAPPPTVTLVRRPEASGGNAPDVLSSAVEAEFSGLVVCEGPGRESDSPSAEVVQNALITLSLSRPKRDPRPPSAPFRGTPMSSRGGR